MPKGVPDATSPPAWLAGLRGKLLLAGAAALVALGIAELAVRILRPQQLTSIVGLYDGVDTLGYVRKPDLRTQVNTGEGPVALFTDRDGYRIGSRGRSEAATRILLMGDSFMESLMLPYEQTLAGLLEVTLPDSLREPIAVRQGGVSGYAPSQYLIATRWALRRERLAGVLVAIFVGNDVNERRTDYYPSRPIEMQPGMHWPRQWSSREIKRGLIFPLAEGMARHSQFMALLWDGSARLRMRVGLWNGTFPGVFLSRRKDGPEWATTTAVCADLAREAAAAGAPAIFVIVPMWSQMDPRVIRAEAAAQGIDSAALDVDQPNRSLTEQFAAAGLRVIDALPALRATVQSGTPVYGTTDHHLNAAGQQVLLTLVQPDLIRLLRGHRPTQ